MAKLRMRSEPHRPGYTVWSYAVRDSRGRVMAEDNGRGWEQMLRQGLADLAAFRRLEKLGYDLAALPSYTELVDKAVL